MSALTGLKVLELGTLIAGPFAARIFGEFGADVIKVETPHGPDGSGGGDPIRSWRHLHQGNSLWWSVQARNKRSIALNLGSARSRHRASAGAEADVVVENYRPVLEKWGLGYEQLRALNPATIMVRLSGYGQTGPMKDQPGFGAIGESMGGLRYVSGHRTGLPLRVGISIGDSIAALHGVIGAMMALRHRDGRAGTAWPARPAGRAGPDGGRGAVRGRVQHDGEPGARVRRGRRGARAPAARCRASCPPTPTPRATARTWSSPATATPSSAA